MNDIKLNNIELICFDKNNIDHLIFLKDLIHDEEINKYFQGFLSNLNRNTDDIFNKAFIVGINNELVGYFEIGTYIDFEQAVYVREAILKNYRGKHLGYGKLILDDVFNYLFLEYNYIKYIKVKINDENISSKKLFLSCGGYNLINDYYQMDNKFNKKSL